MQRLKNIRTGGGYDEREAYENARNQFAKDYGMEDAVMDHDYVKREFADGYYDGIPKEIQNMTSEELDVFIEEEKKKYKKMND